MVEPGLVFRLKGGRPDLDREPPHPESSAVVPADLHLDERPQRGDRNMGPFEGVHEGGTQAMPDRGREGRTGLGPAPPPTGGASSTINGPNGWPGYCAVNRYFSTCSSWTAAVGSVMISPTLEHPDR